MPFTGRIFILLTASTLLACDFLNPEPKPGTAEAEFESPALSTVPVLNVPNLREASGLAASRANAGLLWGANDSGNDARLFLIGSDGNQRAVYTVEGIRNYDWEDLAATTVNGQPTVYLGDIGDNTAVRTACEIYRCTEPTFGGTATGTLRGAQQITFRYPDGAHDAETLLVDHQTGDLFVLTKETTRSRVYRIPFPQATSGVITAEKLGELALGFLTAGDISPDNTEIILKSYTEVFYWKREAGESLMTTLGRTPRKLPYLAEPAGEGMAFAADGSGYFTTGEAIEGIQPRLFFYKRK